MAEKMAIEMKKCITPEFRVSFPSVFKAKSFEQQEPKYSIVMLYDSKTDISKLEKAAFNAAAEKWGTNKAKWPAGLRMPFKDGNQKGDMEGYKNTIVVNASSKQRPGVVDQQKVAIAEDDATFYPGCYARASIIAFAYDKAGNRGVSFSLQNIQKLRDGKPFSGRKEASEEFDAVDNVETDMESDDYDV